jgi:hypothetical protein
VSTVAPEHWSGLLNTTEAARLLGVEPVTVRRWRLLRRLQPQGLDERGRPLHTVQALREAEALVRANSIAATGTDPRRHRGEQSARRLAMQRQAPPGEAA